MNFCRQCGAGLAATPPVGPPGPPPGPPLAPHPPPQVMPPPAAMVGGPSSAGSAAGAATQSCPNCGGQTPSGFAFCQQCGGKLPPPEAARPSPARPPQGMVSGETGGSAAHAATLAAQRGEAAQFAAGVEPSSWGMLISVNRDGTDGEKYPLSGEWVEVGRSGVDLSFEDDAFLARRHARIERKGSAVTVVPEDKLNGVYRRLDMPQNIGDGTVLLAGREVLLFELVREEERDALPLVRHGVSMFGSPPRRPWGRLSQLLPNGGLRDVRHLCDHEVVLGREDGDLVFEDDAFLSRRHAAFRWKDGRCILEDLESSNGTFVRLTGPVTLKPGDHLRMGDQLFRFELTG